MDVRPPLLRSGSTSGLSCTATNRACWFTSCSAGNSGTFSVAGSISGTHGSGTIGVVGGRGVYEHGVPSTEAGESADVEFKLGEIGDV